MTNPDWEGFCRDILRDGWPGTYDIEVRQVFELAKIHNLIRKAPGGYDPEKHGADAEWWWVEPGDEWFEYNFPNKRVIKQEHSDD